MINVVGLGYIGLPTALMFAAHGVEVVGTDYNKELVDTLNEGKTTFEEDGLDELFQEAVSKGIRFSHEYQSTDMYIVAVPTPYDKASKKVDASYVVKAVQNVMSVCPKGATVVIESTVSPGTINKYVRPIIESDGFTIGEDINLVHAPERIIPGNMVYELKHNSRTIGADSLEIGEKVKALYSSFCQGEIVVTDIRTAEMTKVVENTFRDINIAFANELAKICRSDNMDVYEIIRIANKHPRVNILTPGPGVGGHCISVDPWFLVGDYPGLANIILAARKINDGMPDFVLERIHNIMKENNMTDVGRVGLYGLTYKFELTGYYKGTNNTDESAHAAINPEDGYTFRPQMAAEITGKQQAYGAAQGLQTVGRTPVVRVSLIDKYGKVLDYGYIRIEITRPETAVEYNYKEVDFTNGKNNSYADACAINFKGYTVYQSKWIQTEYEIYNLLGMAREDFENYYGEEPVLYDNNEVAQYKKDANGKYVQIAKDKTLGTVVNIPDMDDETHTQTSTLKWLISGYKEGSTANKLLKELYDKYGSKVEFIGVSFDVDHNRWTKYVVDNGMKWRQVSELKKMRDAEDSDYIQAYDSVGCNYQLG